MRCGFCNLFTTTNPKDGIVSSYLKALDRQLETTSEALQTGARFSRAAFGGGTPSFLAPDELETLFNAIEKHLGSLEKGLPMSFELSPATVTKEKLDFLKTRGVSRFSIGVQSFIESETKGLFK